MIDTEALREKVIDLAIRGKLTDQFSSDGDAKNLYAQIQEEREKLVKEGKVRKENTLTSIEEDEKTFTIPKNWIWVRLVSIGSFISGYTPSADDLYDEGNIPYFKVSDMNSYGNELYMVHTNLFLRGDSRTKQFSANTIIYPKNGGALFTNKKRILAQNSVVDLNTGGFLPSHLVCVEYVYLFFRKIDFRDYHKGSAVPTLDMMKMRNILIPLPPLEEQERIVEIVNTAMQYIDNIDAMQQQYDANIQILKNKIIDAGIQGKLTEQLPDDGNADDLFNQIQSEKAKLIKEKKIKKEKPLSEISIDEIPFDIPKNWKWVRLGTCINLLSGQDFKPEDYNDRGEGMPYMTGASNIENESLIINRWTKKPKNISHKDDLLLVCKGSGYGKIAFNNVGDVHIARQFMAVSSTSHIDLKYIAFVLKANIRTIRSNGQGLIPGIDRPSVLNLLLPLPPYKEQKRIVQKLNMLLSTVEQ